jgi:hypothetical protein
VLVWLRMSAVQGNPQRPSQLPKLWPQIWFPVPARSTV